MQFDKLKIDPVKKSTSENPGPDAQRGSREMKNVLSDTGRFVEPGGVPEGYLWRPSFMASQVLDVAALKKSIEEHGLTEEQLRTPENKTAFEEGLVTLLSKKVGSYDLGEFVKIGVLSPEEIQNSEAIQTAAQEHLLWLLSIDDHTRVRSFVEYGGVLNTTKVKENPELQVKLQERLGAFLRHKRGGNMNYAAWQMLEWDVIAPEKVREVAVEHINTEGRSLDYMLHFKNMGVVTEADFTSETKARLLEEYTEGLRQGNPNGWRVGLEDAYLIKKLGIFEDKDLKGGDIKFYIQDSLETEMVLDQSIDNVELALLLSFEALTVEEVTDIYKKKLVRNIRRGYPLKPVLKTLSGISYATLVKGSEEKADRLRPFCQEVFTLLKNDPEITAAIIAEKDPFNAWG